MLGNYFKLLFQHDDAVHILAIHRIHFDQFMVGEIGRIQIVASKCGHSITRIEWRLVTVQNSGQHSSDEEQCPARDMLAS